MLALPSLGASARLLAVVMLVCLCTGGTLARPAPPSPPAKLPAANLSIALPPAPAAPPRLAALDPADLALPPPAPPHRPGPFGLAAAKGGPFAERWHILQPLIRVERLILANCRATPADCPAAAAKFNRIIEAARARDGRARIGEVNRAVNLAIRPMSDMAQYHAPDVWASPLMTFGSGAGDCEDYAIAKYVALNEAGVPMTDLRLVVVHDRVVNEGHMVATARVDGHWLILDNRTMRLANDNDVPNLTPLAALGGASDAPAVAVTPKPAKAPAEAWDTAGLPVVL
jgi:predicted transglutaminase-like cysteine proteinase